MYFKAQFSGKPVPVVIKRWIVLYLYLFVTVYAPVPVCSINVILVPRPGYLVILSELSFCSYQYR